MTARLNDSLGLVGIVNVLDRNVRGDGLGLDGTALNALFTQLSTAGGAVCIMPPRVYNLDTNVTAPNNITLIIAAGTTTTGPGVFATSGTGCILDLRQGIAVQSGSANPVVLGRGSLVEPITSQNVQTFAGTNQTLTAAQLLGGIVEGAPTAAATYTTDTGTNLSAAVPGAAVGDSFDVMIANTAAGAFAITLAAGAGVTLVGSTTTIGQNKTAWIVFRCTGVNTWKAYVTVSA